MIRSGSNDPLWIGVEVGTEEGLGFKFFLWISDQHPNTHRNGTAGKPVLYHTAVW